MIKNTFNLDVCLNKVPLKPYEWNQNTFISGLKLLKVNSKTIEDALLYKLKIETNDDLLLLSDTKTTIVLKLDDNKEIVARSFINFEKDLELSELAINFKRTNINYQILDEKIKYSFELKETTKIKNYVIEALKTSDDENKTKYLYYLYFENIKNYSLSKLIKTIKLDKTDKCLKLYEFLLANN